MIKYSKALLVSNRVIRISLIFCCLTCTTIASKAQTGSSQTLKQLVKIAEHRYGSDDRLVTGTIYQNKFYNAKGHPFFLTRHWKKSTLYIKDNVFENVDILYNLHLDKFVLKSVSVDGIKKNLILNDDFIDSINHDGHLFVKSTVLNLDKKDGYLELAYSGVTKAYLKHRVLYKETLSTSQKIISFIDENPILYLTKGDISKPIYSKRDFLNFYYPNRKEIKKYLSKNRIRIKKINKFQLNSLIPYCDEISKTSEN